MSASQQLLLSGSSQAEESNYIEDVFSTYLYTGNGSTQTITNGIDLAGEGGLLWIKDRSNGTRWHILTDTVRGAGKHLSSNSTFGETAQAGQLSAFTSSGFSVGSEFDVNYSGENFVSWTFRKQPKFFDVVTYTGNGANNRQIAHSLESTPGFIVVKCLSNSGTDWTCYHRSVPTQYGLLNNTSEFRSSVTFFPAVSDTTFTVNEPGFGNTNASGRTYVAYLFAHDSGGFGLSGEDNVISCGSFTTDGSGNATVNLGYEPQWVMVKQTNAAQNWYIEDNMRAFNLTSRAILFPNLSNAEATGASAYLAPNATGFSAVNGQLSASGTYIYIAIRRGPMKVPESGTSVYTGFADSTASPRTLTTGFPVDLAIQGYRNTFSFLGNTGSRLQGANYLRTTNTSEEYTGPIFNWDNNTALVSLDGNSTSKIIWTFRRAPGFFDEICYTSNGSGVTLNHNLTVVPELVIFKARNNAGNDWVVYRSTAPTKRLDLNSTNAEVNEGAFGTFTSTTLALNVDSNINSSISGRTYVAYLFASAPGVSKVGSYTGTGASDQVINCGFTGGARFVMIKRTDGTSNWRVWDTARGITSGNDPSLDLNNTSAEETGFNQVDPDSSGFKVKANDFWNTSGANFIFLAIA